MKRLSRHTPFFKALSHGVLVFILIFFSTAVLAQSRLSSDLKLQASLHAGYSLPEYQFFNLLTDDYVRGFELSIIRETNGDNEWEQIYKLPEHGISLLYSTLGSAETLGEELALTYFFKAYFVQKESFRIYNQTGIGLGYVTKIFDLEENYLNVATGSHFNIHFNTRFGVNFKLTEKLASDVGLAFDHFSNGNTSEPNLGVNYLTGFLGVSYRINPKSERLSLTVPKHNAQNHMKIVASMGGKHTRSLSSEYYLTSSLSFEFNRNITRAFQLGAGTDLFYDSSSEKQLSDIGETHNSSNDFQTGIHFSQSLIYNRMSITLQEGIYLGLTDKVNGNAMYNRGILQYQIGQKTSIRIAMKSHLHILDYPELGLALRL